MWYNINIERRWKKVWDTIKEVLYIVSAVITIASGITEIAKHLRK